MDRYSLVLRTSLLSLIMMVLSACSASQDQLIPTSVASLPSNQSSSELEQTPTLVSTLESQSPTPTPTSNDFALFLPDCSTRSSLALPTVPSPDVYQGWYRYANTEYGFSFNFPPDWILAKGPHYICLMPQLEPELVLVIGWKHATEDVSIQRTGVGAGEIITRGRVTFLDQEISRDVLVYQGKEKAVLYNFATEIETSDLAFTLSLDDFRTDYEAAALSEEVQAVSDKIIETFELAKAEN